MILSGNIAAILPKPSRYELEHKFLAILPGLFSHHNVAVNCGFRFPVNSNMQETRNKLDLFESGNVLVKPMNCEHEIYFIR